MLIKSLIKRKIKFIHSFHNFEELTMWKNYQQVVELLLKNLLKTNLPNKLDF